MVKKLSKKQKKNRAAEELISHSRPILEMRYADPIFQMAFHPTKPIFFSGLATGYIYCYTYDSDGLKELFEENQKQYEQSGYDGDIKPWFSHEVSREDVTFEDDSPLKLLWRTKRHKGSVRGLCLENDGSFLYSVGTDNVLKKSDSETGKVVNKVTLKARNSKITKMVKSGTHPYLILGDEDGNVSVIDSENLSVTNIIRCIHSSDAINDIFHFSKRSMHKYISMGQTTLAYWDSRQSNETDFKIAEDDKEAKRKVLLSDDQEDELLCGTFVDPEVGDTVVCGMGEGVLTVWKPNKNDLEDQVNRIKIAKEESIDCIVPTLQDDNCIWCGCSNGNIYKVDVKKGSIVEIRKHSDLEEVSLLDLDYEYRVASGGMDKVLLWELDNETAAHFEVNEEKSDETSVLSSRGSDSECDDDNHGYSSGSDEIWDNLNDTIGPDQKIEDEGLGRDSDPDSDTPIGPSKEELIAELDKDIFGEEDTLQGKRPKGSQEKTQKAKKIKEKRRKLNNSHGITKFDDL